MASIIVFFGVFGGFKYLFSIKIRKKAPFRGPSLRPWREVLEGLEGREVWEVGAVLGVVLSMGSGRRIDIFWIVK